MTLFPMQQTLTTFEGLIFHPQRVSARQKKNLALLALS